MLTPSRSRIASIILSTFALCGASLSCTAGPAAPVSGITGPQARGGFTTSVQKSNGAGIEMQYRVDASAGAGQPASVRLIFSGVTDPDASVRFTADASLSSPASAGLPIGTSELTLRIVPSSDGLFYLNAFISQRGATSVVSIPVSSGKAEPKLKSMGESKPTPDGEKIIPLPVR